MPSFSRRKTKQPKKHKTWTILNHHSSPPHQIQGEAVSANNTEKMEGFVNGTIQENHKAQSQSLSENKEVAVEVDDSQDGDIVITHEEEAPQNEENKMLVESGKVEETREDVSESVVSETFEPDTVKDAHVENTVESDTVMLEFNEDFESDPDGVKETDLYPSVSRNEGLRETEVAEEEKNVVFHAVGEEANDVCGESSLVETSETSVPKSCESDKVTPTIIEKSLDLKQSLEEKVEESSGGLEESSYESAKESFQPSPSVVPDAESNENQTTVPMAQREFSSWKSCCGLIEIMRGGHR
ncbi:neurofilament medium polypeptide-like isoform X1 [Vigna umbellata]|uniref:neurofilament medium polypeptide-like isoform X1 n=1 Tax=Vigna umbellata TaxID=87088 RepID=UPI001F5F6BB2|nr:neurofilament medium polypeptide-like isoform X1 [Vigna umbellata]XP_047163171.1 neurofilament medium polypeptide-like isoform X1 [Vigna umbellata]